MMTGVFLNLISFVGALAVMAGIGQIMVMNRRRENRNLAALFGVIGVLLLQVSAVLRHGEAMPWMYLYHASLLFCLGPLLLLAYNAVVYPGRPFPVWSRFLFIPAVISFLAETFFLVTGGGNGLYLHEIMNRLPLDRNAKIMLVFLVLACLQDVLYILRFLVGIVPLALVTSGNVIVNWTIIFASGSLAAILLLGATYLTGNGIIMGSAGLITSICILGVYCLGQRYPHYLHIFKAEVARRKYSKSLLSRHDVDDMCQRLKSLMEEGRIYRDDNLSLKSLADSLNITPQQLSQLLNDKMKTSFHTYINNFRIEEATHLLLEDYRRPVLSIAYEVGFNTKSSFYDAFSRYTGKTPQQYRRDYRRQS